MKTSVRMRFVVQEMLEALQFERKMEWREGMRPIPKLRLGQSEQADQRSKGKERVAVRQSRLGF